MTAGTAARTPGTFTILAVCTGNICRSPAIERWLAAGLGPGSDVTVTSAGTRAVVGAPISAPMAELITAGGGSAAGFAARQITAPMIRDTSLVLTATRDHRAAVVDLWPAAVRRVFTLREFARLVALVGPEHLDSVAPLGSSPGARLAALVPLAVACRGQERVEKALDDVTDPIGRPATVYQKSADEIWPAVQTVARSALGRARPRPSGTLRSRSTN